VSTTPDTPAASGRAGEAAAVGAVLDALAWDVTGLVMLESAPRCWSVLCRVCAQHVIPTDVWGWPDPNSCAPLRSIAARMVTLHLTDRHPGQSLPLLVLPIPAALYPLLERAGASGWRSDVHHAPAPQGAPGIVLTVTLNAGNTRSGAFRLTTSWLLDPGGALRHRQASCHVAARDVLTEERCGLARTPDEFARLVLDYPAIA